jgi:hypothetical protein
MKKWKKARVSQTRAPRKRKRVIIRRKTVAKKKSSSTWDEPEDQDVEENTVADADATADQGEGEEAPPAPVPTETAADDGGVYVVDSVEISIKGQLYHQGDKVSLTPEELEAVQASGVRILPVE